MTSAVPMCRVRKAPIWHETESLTCIEPPHNLRAQPVNVKAVHRKLRWTLCNDAALPCLPAFQIVLNQQVRWLSWSKRTNMPVGVQDHGDLQTPLTPHARKERGWYETLQHDVSYVVPLQPYRISQAFRPTVLANPCASRPRAIHSADSP